MLRPDFREPAEAGPPRFRWWRPHRPREATVDDQLALVLAILRRVRDGDPMVRIPLEATGGMVREVAEAVNDLIGRDRVFAGELARISRAVVQDGQMSERAVRMAGDQVWGGGIDSLNALITALVRPLTEVDRVISAIAAGDLSQKMAGGIDGQPGQGELRQLASTVNTLVDQLNSFASEVTRVAREVGTEGKLGGQAQVQGVSGTWKDLTDSVNLMASHLTAQVRDIADVTTAVAMGDLSKTITADVKGEFLELKDTINTMVDRLNAFASEVTRVARDVGTEGKLGGQAVVKGVSGTWKDLTDNVNGMAANLTTQVRGIAKVVSAVAVGDLKRKLVLDARGEIAELAETINGMIDTLALFGDQVSTVAREVGTEGKLGGQAQVPGAAGLWRDLTDNVNLMASNLTSQVRNIAEVTTAVARGDLSKTITVGVQGEIRELKDTINTMVDQLNSFASEVTRVAREVGTEGKLGGQAEVRGVGGTWKDLTNNVNRMASNLTAQVRAIAGVTTAVARGDLSRKITVDARGEIRELKDTINTMVDQLNSFASEVTRVAHEVGTEGKLGGQAQVQGVAGTWKDLTDNVNLMAGNLTSQVRGIARVVSAVAVGDLKPKLVLEAKGEIAELAATINGMTDTLSVFAAEVTTVTHEVGVEGKLGGQATVPGAAGTWKDLVNNVNQMIVNLRKATQDAMDQDWLKTNLARFSNMLQGQRQLQPLATLLMSDLPPTVSAQMGALYVAETVGKRTVLKQFSTYAYESRKRLSNHFELGQGLVGQCALEKKCIVIKDVPDDYVHISSGLGDAQPHSVIVLPILFEGQVKGVIELASLQPFTPIQVTFLDQVSQSIGVVVNLIAASMRTEELLEELKHSNEQLGSRTAELEEKASQLEDKNREIAEASASLEEKAKQLALVSQYKSRFLANMSHELRTPLNSMLILAKMLADNADQALPAKQVEYARTIHASGRDLLALIDDILDLSKIEAGRMAMERRRVPLHEIAGMIERDFRPLAVSKGLGFEVVVDEAVPATLSCDPQRLMQILKNLLSNAFKFTEAGQVEVRIAATGPQQVHEPALKKAPGIIAFAASDTGIGIAKDKQRLIFEAFQQADSSMSRRYGGTGLGLTISRELAKLLGGELGLHSVLDKGSTFTLYLPLTTEDMLAPPQPAAEPHVRRERLSAAVSAERPPSELPAPRKTPAPLKADRPANGVLAGKKVLVVDDDGRNLFAVTSLLEAQGMQVSPATSAREAIDVLGREPDVALVLMDVMMPDMDGYAATREIRRRPQFASLPIIALTAKVMQGDREKVLEAGMSDFVAKPVDTDQLLAVLRRWLSQ
jgi:signal transduction histidine kinase/HAMP domain-containing protein/CheY-like chemotaxis protein